MSGAVSPLSTPVPNAVRGEASVRVAGVEIVLRPTFAALVAAEAELGSLFALAERAAAGGVMLAEMVALFWHCRHVAPEAVTRAQLGEAIAEGGLAQATPTLGTLLRQILSGR